VEKTLILLITSYKELRGYYLGDRGALDSS